VLFVGEAVDSDLLLAAGTLTPAIPSTLTSSSAAGGLMSSLGLAATALKAVQGLVLGGASGGVPAQASALPGPAGSRNLVTSSESSTSVSVDSAAAIASAKLCPSEASTSQTQSRSMHRGCSSLGSDDKPLLQQAASGGAVRAPARMQAAAGASQAAAAEPAAVEAAPAPEEKASEGKGGDWYSMFLTAAQEADAAKASKAALGRRSALIMEGSSTLTPGTGTPLSTTSTSLLTAATQSFDPLATCPDALSYQTTRLTSQPSHLSHQTTAGATDIASSIRSPRSSAAHAHQALAGAAAEFGAGTLSHASTVLEEGSVRGAARAANYTSASVTLGLLLSNASRAQVEVQHDFDACSSSAQFSGLYAQGPGTVGGGVFVNSSMSLLHSTPDNAVSTGFNTHSGGTNVVGVLGSASSVPTSMFQSLGSSLTGCEKSGSLESGNMPRQQHPVLRQLTHQQSQPQKQQQQQKQQEAGAGLPMAGSLHGASLVFASSAGPSPSGMTVRTSQALAGQLSRRASTCTPDAAEAATGYGCLELSPTSTCVEGGSRGVLDIAQMMHIAPSQCEPGAEAAGQGAAGSKVPAAASAAARRARHGYDITSIIRAADIEPLAETTQQFQGLPVVDSPHGWPGHMSVFSSMGLSTLNSPPAVPALPPLPNSPTAAASTSWVQQQQAPGTAGVLMHNPLAVDLRQFLGSGGSGNVWKGVWHGHTVAIKVVAHVEESAQGTGNPAALGITRRSDGGVPNLSNPTEWQTRVMAEAELGTQMEHPHLLKTYSYALVSSTGASFERRHSAATRTPPLQLTHSASYGHQSNQSSLLGPAGRALNHAGSANSRNSSEAGFGSRPGGGCTPGTAPAFSRGSAVDPMGMAMQGAATGSARGLTSGMNGGESHGHAWARRHSAPPGNGEDQPGAGFEGSVIPPAAPMRGSAFLSPATAAAAAAAAAGATGSEALLVSGGLSSAGVRQGVGIGDLERTSSVGYSDALSSPARSASRTPVGADAGGNTPYGLGSVPASPHSLTQQQQATPASLFRLLVPVAAAAASAPAPRQLPPASAPPALPHKSGDTLNLATASTKSSELVSGPSAAPAAATTTSRDPSVPLAVPMLRSRAYGSALTLAGHVLAGAGAEPVVAQRWEAHIVTEYADAGTLRSWAAERPLFAHDATEVSTWLAALESSHPQQQQQQAGGGAVVAARASNGGEAALSGEALEQALSLLGSVRHTLQGLEMAVSICSALVYLHERGIVHGDLKLSNVLLVTRPITSIEPPGHPGPAHSCNPADDAHPKLQQQQLASAADADAGSRECGRQMAVWGLLRSVSKRESGSGHALVSAPLESAGGSRGPDILASYGSACSTAAAAAPSSPKHPKRLVAKVSDYGLSRMLLGPQHTHITTTGCTGTLAYQSPEVLCSGHLSAATDIYALGILMWELTAGCLAFHDLTIPQLVWAKTLGVLHEHLPWAAGVPAQFVHAASACWATNPAARPSAAEVEAALRQVAAVQSELLQRLLSAVGQSHNQRGSQGAR